MSYNSQNEPRVCVGKPTMPEEPNDDIVNALFRAAGVRLLFR